jgi:transposase
MTNDTIGVDISKGHLDAYRMSDGASRRLANDKAGHGALINWLGAAGTRIVFEPTDPLDAAMLARMGALLELEARPVRSPILSDLKDLHVAREALVKNRTAAKNRAKILTLAILKRHNAEQLKQIERQVAAIETEIMALIKADPDLARRFTILVSIPGVSAITAFALLIDMPELGSLSRGQAASLAGLAPVARQSGRWTGRAFIRGGRANVRHALYMPALVATRFNPDFKATYENLKATGKPSKIAITAVMRKLIVLANALVKANRNWTPKPA